MFETIVHHMTLNCQKSVTIGTLAAFGMNMNHQHNAKLVLGPNWYKTEFKGLAFSDTRFNEEENLRHFIKIFISTSAAVGKFERRFKNFSRLQFRRTVVVLSCN